jgi:DNA-directed RNA polymerase specialized sigma24 family protein
LYDLWFDRVYAYLRLTLDQKAEHDARACAVFAEALRDVTGSAPGIADVRAWLFGQVYAVARKEAPEVERDGDRSHTSPCKATGGAGHASGLEWLTDDDLLVLIARRPLAERHVLLLGYLGGLGSEQIARIMELDAGQVRDLHRLAMTSIEASLTAIVRSPRMAGRLPMSRLDRTSRVLDRRRRALLAA